MIEPCKQNFHRVNAQTVLYKKCQSLIIAELTRRGTVLGLSMPNDIVKAQRGELLVKTSKVEFALFEFMLHVKY